MNSELVSVVITTYARPYTLRRAINSVLSQTYKNIEIIVVDDNKDMSVRNEVVEIVKAYEDMRLQLVCNEKNLGGALARNVGIAHSNAKYVAFLDDDDEYYPEKIEKQLQLMTTSSDKLALVYCYCEMIDKKHKLERIYNNMYKGNCVFEGMCDCIAATSQWFCRKEALISVNGFSDVPCKQDSNLIVKLLTHGYEVNFVPEVLSKYYRDADGSISTSKHEKRIEGEEALLNLCREHYNLITIREQEIVEYYAACRLAEHYLAIGRYSEFKRCINLIIKHPFSVKSLGVVKRSLKEILK